jgi:hypothetical protein
MNIKQSDKDYKKALESFLDEKPKINEENPEMDCSSGVCIIKGDKSIQERINKKIIIEDGRQLLI